MKTIIVTLIDDIVVGCVEKKIIDSQTVEIAALAISTKFRNQRVGVFTVKAFMDAMIDSGYKHFISLTNNPRLKKLYLMLGFSLCSGPEFKTRQAASPGVAMYLMQIEVDGFVKSPISALRFIPRHCGVR